MTDERDHTYIAGKEVRLTREEIKQPTEAEVMDDALDKLESKRNGGSVSSEVERQPNDEESAFKRLQDEREEARLAEENEAERSRQEQERNQQESIRQASQWAESDQQVINDLTQRAQALEQRKADYEHAVKMAQQYPHQVTSEQRQLLTKTREEIQQEEQELQNATTKVEQAAQYKGAEAERRKLAKDFPELADPKTKKELVEWAVSKGIPRDVAQNETRREIVARAYQQMRDEKKAEHEKWLNRPRKPIAQRGALSQGGSTPDRMTVDQAREQLRRTGSTSDALNFLTLARERANEI